MLRYSISNWIYGDEPLETNFKRLSKFGYDGIELKGEPSEYDVDNVKKLLKKYNLKVLSIAGMYPWPTAGRDLSNPDPKIRERAIKYLRDTIDFAVKISAPLIIVVPSAVGKAKPVENPQDEESWEKSLKQEWIYSIDSVKKASKFAEVKEVYLAIEPINRYETFLVNNAQQAIDYVKEVDSKYVKVHLDTFHMNIEENNIADAIKKTGNLLINLHIADSNRQAVGNGHIDFKLIIKTLLEINYKGALALEPLPPLPDPYIAMRVKRFKNLWDKYAKQSIENLKKYEKELIY